MFTTTLGGRRRHRAAVASIALLSVLAAACGSDATSTSTIAPATTLASTSVATTQPATTDSSAATATTPVASTTTGGGDTVTSAQPATGEPVSVWVIEDSSEAAGVTFPTVRAGIDSRVARINISGGLGGSGRTVEVKYCVTNFDPNAAAQCARDAVADTSAIAVVGSVSANGDSTLPILEAGGLANVSSTAFAASDGTNKNSFPTMGGLVSATGCQATMLRDKADAKKIGLIIGDTPGADQTGGLLMALGLPPVGEVVTPIANPDYSAEIGAIATQADAVVLAQDGATARKTVRGINQIGAELKIAGSGGQGWTPSAIKDVGDAANGVYLSLWYAADDSTSPGVQQYLADLAAAGKADLSDDLAKLGWVGFDLLDHVASTLKTIDRSTILAGLGTTNDYDSGGLAPVIDFTKPGKLLGGAMPRFVNTTCAYAQIQDGKIVGLGDFVSPFTS